VTTERPFRTDIASSDLAHIQVRGLDLADELMTSRSFGDVVFLLIAGRLPTEPEHPLVEAMLTSLVEHGLTPSAAVARVTYSVAPESLQGAVAAGLLGVGSVVLGSMEQCGRLLSDLRTAMVAGSDRDTAIGQALDDLAARGSPVPGLGHVTHKDGDPRTTRLFAIAAELGPKGPYVETLEALAAAAAERRALYLPINVTGAVAALLLELGVPWQLHRGFALVSRSAGLVAHIAEERTAPIAPELRALLRG
jgi:citrate synthase